jgi:hypothetical protein
MGGTVQNFDITAKRLKRGLTAETRRLSRRYFLSRTRYAVRELGASIARSIRGFGDACIDGGDHAMRKDRSTAQQSLSLRRRSPTDGWDRSGTTTS